MKKKILQILDEKRDEIARLHAERLRNEVLAFRAVPAEKIVDATRLLIGLFVQHLRAGESAMPMEIEVLSRERARIGTSPGEMAESWLRCVATARDVVLATFPDGELRSALAAWGEIDRVVAVITGWMVEQHRKNVEAKR